MWRTRKRGARPSETVPPRARARALQRTTHIVETVAEGGVGRVAASEGGGSARDERGEDRGTSDNGAAEHSVTNAFWGVACLFWVLLPALLCGQD